jgi:spermidine/putrescine-binding protein
MICFWLGIFLLFLICPQFIQYFYKQKSITVLTWPTLIDAQKLGEFEQQTGIKVYLRYFENNEELFAKIKATKGYGYDLIMPSDYIVQLMINEGLLKKIDKTKLTFFQNLYPHLVGNYYDPANEYSVPFFWSIYGIAYDKTHFKIPPEPSWALVFDSHKAQEHTCMIDDARELILIAAQYLYGKATSLSNAQLKEIKQLLIEQRAWVEMYSEERSNFQLASKASPVAVIFSAIVSRIMRHFDDIEFMIPQEGSFLVVDSFAMPKTSDKDDLVYQFLNYVYKPEVLAAYIKKYGYFSPIKNIPVQGRLPLPNEEQFKKIDFFRNILTKKQISDLWIDLKA